MEPSEVGANWRMKQSCELVSSIAEIFPQEQEESENYASRLGSSTSSLNSSFELQPAQNREGGKHYTFVRKSSLEPEELEDSASKPHSSTPSAN